MEFAGFIAFMITAGAVMACVDILKRISNEIKEIDERAKKESEYIGFLCSENNRMIREVLLVENAEK